MNSNLISSWNYVLVLQRIIVAFSPLTGKKSSVTTSHFLCTVNVTEILQICIFLNWSTLSAETDQKEVSILATIHRKFLPQQKNRNGGLAHATSLRLCACEITQPSPGLFGSHKKFCSRRHKTVSCWENSTTNI